MSRRSKIIVCSSFFLLLLCGLIAWQWQPILRAYDTRILSSATSALPVCDRVEVFHLDGSFQLEAANGFPVRPREAYSAILATSTLNGPDAVAFADQWRSQVFGEEYQAMCHSPAYGFRFYRGSSLKFETTVCFDCSNFYISGRTKPYYWGFDRKSPKAIDLLTRLQQLFPASIPKPKAKPATK